MGFPGGPPPAVPEGWMANWSDQYNQWFYLHSTTGASQWEHPSGPAYASQLVGTPQPGYYPPAQPQYAQHAVTPQPGYYPPAQPQYAQQGFAPPPPAAQQAAPAKVGIMGKLSSLDPKAQTALAVGGGLAAGALLEHEIEEHSNKFHFSHQGGGHHVLGTMAGLIGAAGAGVLGTKLFGKMGQGGQATPPPPQPSAYPAMPPGAPAYSVSPPGPPAYPVQAPPQPAYSNQPMPTDAPGSGPGLGGLGKFAVGGAAGMAGALAVSGASNLLHHHNSEDGAFAGAPPAAGGSGSMGSFLGGSTHSGPRLIIHAAAYADRDVTDKVKARVTPDQVFTIENMNDEFGDPWPEAERKMFSVLYQYGDRPLEVWAGSVSSGKVIIRHEALSNARMSYINKDPGRIVCLIWGEQSILSKERVEKLEKDGELDCTDLGNGGFYPWDVRNLICYYRDAHGGIGIGHGREHGTMRLPWNPLAKWS